MKLQKKTQPEKVSPMKALKERKSYVDSMQEELEDRGVVVKKIIMIL